ncbi:CsbD family protein [Aciduricibacillus chroicocephali]|uniref:CsbD family protein n=1 Tax=Aciduricibacillus chroicocephali TaxID=3054939 RepID=A0ABY9KT99_9BACI|nr:CsbD family protein [Bacillaceae bacterium 44XB]
MAEERRKDGMDHKIEGAADKMKGEAKDQIGQLTDDKSKQAEGKWDKLKGEAKDSLGNMKNKMDRD